MASPLLGIAGVNSLLFASYAASKRIVSPFPQLTLPQIALAGAMAGAANAVLASPGVTFSQNLLYALLITLLPCALRPVEMFKVRMQGQYGASSDKRLRDIAREMWQEWGFKRGIMRGYWVRTADPRERCVFAMFLVSNSV